MTGLVTFITGLLAVLVLIVGPALAIAIFNGGVSWMTGNHERGKSLLIAAVIGAAICLAAKSLADQFVALPHA